MEKQKWTEVKKELCRIHRDHRWFKGAGIGADGVIVLVHDEEDESKVPTEIDGVKISTTVIGEITLHSIDIK